MKSTEKYFKQKNWSIPEIICVVAIIIAIIIIIAVSIPVGVPLGGVAIVVLVFSKSAKIKDAEIDRELEKMIQAHGITLAPNNSVAVYDLRRPRIVKGKDGKLRSDGYVICSFGFGKEVMEITVYRFELLTGEVTEETYNLSWEDEVTLQEEAIMTPVGRKTVHTLAAPVFKMPIPVSVDDVQSSKLIEAVCSR